MVYYQIPVFMLLLTIEVVSFRYLRDDDLIGYEARDTRTSLTMGAGSVVVNAGWKLAALVVYAGLYELTPLRMPVDEWWTYVLLFFGEDLCHYWWHRVHHEVRIFWASHVVHHSSEHYNLSTALRQPWTPMTGLPFWAPLALLGFAPWMIFLQVAISQIYQFWVHTERVRKLPGWFEFLFNTPSHHRVHHGANEVYLDRNYGSTLIVWDRIFGTYQNETEQVRYGLTKNIDTFNPTRVAFHEFVAIVRDVRAASRWRDKLGYLFRRPGWSPDGSGGGTRG